MNLSLLVNKEENNKKTELTASENLEESPTKAEKEASNDWIFHSTKKNSEKVALPSLATPFTPENDHHEAAAAQTTDYQFPNMSRDTTEESLVKLNMALDSLAAKKESLGDIFLQKVKQKGKVFTAALT